MLATITSQDDMQELEKIISRMNQDNGVDLHDPEVRKSVETEIDGVYEAKALRELRHTVHEHYNNFAKNLAKTLVDDGEKSLTLEKSNLFKTKVVEKEYLQNILDKTIFAKSNFDDFVYELKDLNSRMLIKYVSADDFDDSVYNLKKETSEKIEQRLDKMLNNIKTMPQLRNLKIDNYFYSRLSENLHRKAYDLIDAWETGKKERHAAIEVIENLAKLGNADKINSMITYAITLKRGPTGSGRHITVGEKNQSITDVDAERVMGLFKKEFNLIGIEPIFALTDKYDLSNQEFKRITDKSVLEILLPNEIKPIAKKIFENYELLAQQLKKHAIVTYCK